MGGTLGDVVIADGIIKHSLGLVCGFDPEEAYEAIRKNAFNTSGNTFFGRPQLQHYIDDGFLVESEFRDARDQTGVSESVTRSLEHMLCDAAIANAAANLGKVDDARELRRRSRRYTNLFNPSHMAFQPRSREGNGSFLEPFELDAWRWGFTEGNAWHYRFFVPHDVDGLKLLYSGELCTHLENMFLDQEDPALNPGGYSTIIHEMNEAAKLSRKAFGQYAHNNQPVHHILWVAKKAGCDEVADHFLRRTVRELYTMQTFAGDEDNGEMTAWYILSALGLYQLEGSVNELLVGSPSIMNATIHFQGADLQITTRNQGEHNRFVQAATWTPKGGRRRLIQDSVLPFDEVLRGGHLHIILGPSPAEHSPSSVLV
jgi:predicted alpha-1,2-mannosidase